VAAKGRFDGGQAGRTRLRCASARRAGRTASDDDGAAEGRWYSQTQAARRLGLAQETLSRYGREEELFAPAVRAPFGAGTPLGRRLVRYHAEQLEIIEGFLVGNVDAETARLRWAVARRRIGGTAVGRVGPVGPGRTETANVKERP